MYKDWFAWSLYFLYIASSIRKGEYGSIYYNNPPANQIWKWSWINLLALCTKILCIKIFLVECPWKNRITCDIKVDQESPINMHSLYRFPHSKGRARLRQPLLLFHPLDMRMVEHNEDIFLAMCMNCLCINIWMNNVIFSTASTIFRFIDTEKSHWAIAGKSVGCPDQRLLIY